MIDVATILSLEHGDTKNVKDAMDREVSTPDHQQDFPSDKEHSQDPCEKYDQATSQEEE
jgi:hypothetical protein